MSLFCCNDSMLMVLDFWTPLYIVQFVIKCYVLAVISIRGEIEEAIQEISYMHIT